MDKKAIHPTCHNRPSVHGVYIIEQDLLKMRTQSNIKHTTFITHINFKSHAMVQAASY